MTTRNKLKNQRGGYTIIETMITISLFTIIVMSGMGALLNANALYQKSQSMRSIIDSLSFVMEDMSRNLRTGSNYHCLVPNQVVLPTTPKSCNNGVGIAFEVARGIPNNNSDQWVYYVSNGDFFKSIDGAITSVQLNPDEVEITKLDVLVEGAEPPPGDLQQPFATIRISGSITYKNIVSPFSIQTSASQRTVDI